MTIVSRVQALSAASRVGLAGGLLGVIVSLYYIVEGVLNVAVGLPGPLMPQSDLILAGLVALAFSGLGIIGSVIAHRKAGGALLVVSAIGFLVAVNPFRAGLVSLVLLIAGIWRLRER